MSHFKCRLNQRFRRWGEGGGGQVIWTKSKRTATFFRGTFSNTHNNNNIDNNCNNDDNNNNENNDIILSKIIIISSSAQPL